MSGDLLRIVFVAQSLAIVVFVAAALLLMKKFVRLWEAYLDLAAKHTSLTREAASGMTERIITAVEKVPAASATKVLEGQAAVGVPPAPRNLMDSCKMLIAGCFLLVGAGSLAFSPQTQVKGADMEPCKALRKGLYETAVKSAERDGEPLRKAEALILLGRLDEAEAALATDPCGQAKFLLAVVADKRGFPDRASQLYQEAAELGNEQAKCAVAAGWRAE